MHPLIAERRRLAPYLGLWLPLGGMLAALQVTTAGASWLEALAVVLPLSLIYAFVCLSAWYVCRSLPLAGSGLPRIVATQLAAAAVSASLWLMLGRGWTFLLSASSALPQAAARFRAQAPLFFVVGVLLFLLALAVHYVLIAFEASRAAERRAFEAMVFSRDAELKTLRAQLQPHFLFNSLNSISALTGTRPQEARRMCLLLSDFLRKSLGLGAQQRITLAEELDLAGSFLAIEQVRFGERLTSEQRIDEAARACLVPPLLLQPLVENGVTHGIARLVEGGRLLIEARRQEGRLTIALENPCDPRRPASSGTGVGLENVRRRLATLYGREGRMAATESDGRFRVEIWLPAEP